MRKRQNKSIDQATKIAELEAKVNFYEAMVAKSNFYPFVEKPPMGFTK